MSTYIKAYLGTTPLFTAPSSAELIKNGLGTVTLSAANTYSGGTTINAGTLTTSIATGLGSGTVTVNGGALTINYGAVAFAFTNNLTGNGTVNLTAANAGFITVPVFRPISMSGFNGTVTMDTGFNNIYYQINPNSGSTFDGSSAKWVVNNQNANSFVYTLASLVKYGELSGNGKVSAANANNTLEVGALGTNSTFSGILLNNNFGGTLAFTKVGSGTLTLSGNNTYTGATTINAGTLEITGGGRLGGGSYGGAITNNGTLIYSGNNDQTLSGVISGSGGLTKQGSGTLVLNGANTFTGATAISAGLIRVAKAVGGITGTATYSPTSLTVDFANVTPTSGAAYRFFPGSTATTGLTISLTNAGGKTATYDYSNSTLTIV